MKKTIDKLTDILAWFLGSWWAVVLHTVWFTIWLTFNFNIDTLTLFVSLEAIFIGIFLLMASNRAELQRDKLQAKEQAKMLTEIEEDLSVDQQQDKKLDIIVQKLAKLEKTVSQLKSKK